MNNQENNTIQESNNIVMGTFGYVPYLKKDSREKIINALEDLLELDTSQSAQQQY